jgi:hypothetical protein
MKETVENLDRKVEGAEPELVMKELSFDELQKESKKAQEDKDQKAPQLSIEDVKKVCKIHKTYKLPSKFDEGEFYTAVLLTMEDGSNRWKSINSWDKENISKAKGNAFVVSTITHKGSIKLVLKQTDGLVAGF